ncbi:hypothetical protein [Pectobacterium versatile]|uniref:hypothetical protein n=1 Tax=Pectobacterium versatile TaxID=2488639 RepID=UPI003863E715
MEEYKNPPILSEEQGKEMKIEIQKKTLTPKEKLNETVKVFKELKEEPKRTRL